MSTRLAFLSHAGHDLDAAQDLARRIEEHPVARQQGLRVWLDRRDLLPGQPWMDQVEEAIERRSDAFVLLVNRAGPSSWVRFEMRSALERVVEEGRRGGSYPFVPVIGPGVDERVLPTFARQFQGVRLDVNGTAIDEIVRACLGTGERAPTMYLDEPFFGLEAFRSEDAPLFFGREKETERLIERLQRTNLVVVVGESGSGKSSLVKAGLVPAFREGAFADPLGRRPDPGQWNVVEVRPGAEPFERLVQGAQAAALDAGVGLEKLGTIAEWVRTRDPGRVRDALRLAGQPGAALLLVVDQFEELWTLAPDEDRALFLRALLELTRSGDKELRVVATMRHDYSYLCAEVEELSKRIEENDRAGRFPLRRMSPDGLRDAVVRPLAMAGTSEPEAKSLAEAVLQDVSEQPGDLALLEMALTETWNRRREFDSDLLRAYQALGRVEGALAKAAEDAFENRSDDPEKLGAAERPVAEALFMRLVRLGDAAGVTRRIARQSELAPECWSVAQKLATKPCRRLVVIGPRDEAAPSAESTVEVAHEQLVTQWGRYQSWLRNTKDDPARVEDKRALDRLVDHVRQWKEKGESDGDLETGSDLVAFCRLLERPHWLSDDERIFVERSRALVEQQRRARRRNQFILRALVVLSLTGAAATGIASWFAIRGAARAEERAIDTEASLLWHPIGGGGGEEVGALRSLSRARMEVQEAFLRQLFSSENLAERFEDSADELVCALAGVDQERRMSLIAALEQRTSRPLTPAEWRAVPAFAVELEWGAALPVLLPSSEDEARLSSHSLAALATVVSADRAEECLQRILETRLSDRDLRTTCQALYFLIERLPIARVRPAYERLLSTRSLLQRDRKPGEVDLLQASASRLIGNDAMWAVDGALEHMSVGTDSRGLFGALAAAANAWARTCPPDDKGAACDKILDALEGAEADGHTELLWSLELISDGCDPERLYRNFRVHRQTHPLNMTHARMGLYADSTAGEALLLFLEQLRGKEVGVYIDKDEDVPVLVQLAKRMPSADLEKAVQLLIPAWDSSGDFLSPLLRALIDRLDSDQAVRTLDRLLRPRAQLLPEDVLENVAEKVQGEHVEPAFARAVAALVGKYASPREIRVILTTLVRKVIVLDLPWTTVGELSVEESLFAELLNLALRADGYFKIPPAAAMAEMLVSTDQVGWDVTPMLRWTVSESPTVIAALASGLERVATHEDDVLPLADALASALEQTVSDEDVVPLTRSVLKVAELGTIDVKPIWEAALESSRDGAPEPIAVSRLVALAHELSGAQRDSFLEALIVETSSASGPRTARVLGAFWAEVAPTLERGEQTERIAEAVKTAAISHHRRPQLEDEGAGAREWGWNRKARRPDLRTALSEVVRRLPEDRAKTEVAALVDAIEAAPSPDEACTLFAAWAGLPAPHEEARADGVADHRDPADRALAVVSKLIGGSELSKENGEALVRALEDLAGPFGVASERTIRSLLDAISDDTPSDTLDVLDAGIAKLAEQLTSPPALLLVEPLLGAIERTHPLVRDDLGPLVVKILARLRGAEAKAASKTLLAAAESTSDPDSIDLLDDGLRALSKGIADDRDFVDLQLELLRQPYFGRAGVLTLLRERFPAALPAEQGYWALIEWLQQRFPGLDFRYRRPLERAAR